MNCANCKNTFDLQRAIEGGLFSWPQRGTFWYECNYCEKGNHIRLSKGEEQLIKLLGSPGYEYEVISTFKAPSIEIRIGPKFLHVLYLGKHYEISERA